MDSEAIYQVKNKLVEPKRLKKTINIMILEYDTIFQNIR